MNRSECCMSVSTNLDCAANLAGSAIRSSGRQHRRRPPTSPSNALTANTRNPGPRETRPCAGSARHHFARVLAHPALDVSVQDFSENLKGSTPGGGRNWPENFFVQAGVFL